MTAGTTGWHGGSLAGPGSVRNGGCRSPGGGHWWGGTVTPHLSSHTHLSSSHTGSRYRHPSPWPSRRRGRQPAQTSLAVSKQSASIVRETLNITIAIINGPIKLNLHQNQNSSLIFKDQLLLEEKNNCNKSGMASRQITKV